MYYQEEQWVQSASGFWMPKQQGNPKKQHLLEQKVQPDPEPVRDWKAYWETRGQAWRQEPEIDQERQQFLLKRLESDEERAVSPFQGITLSRADIEWLVEGGQRKALDLREAILNRSDLHFLPLEGADFGSAKLEGVGFWSAELKGAHFVSAQLEGADFGSAKGCVARMMKKPKWLGPRGFSLGDDSKQCGGQRDQPFHVSFFHPLHLPFP